MVHFFLDILKIDNFFIYLHGQVMLYKDNFASRSYILLGQPNFDIQWITKAQFLFQNPKKNRERTIWLYLESDYG